MILRNIDLSKDYLDLCIWWSIHQWPCPEKTSLPKTGLIVEDYCAGFIYSTDSDMCLMEWIIGNPDSNSSERTEALNLLVDGLVKKATELGFKHIFTSTAHQRLIDRYKTFNFKETDNKMTNLMRTN